MESEQLLDQLDGENSAYAEKRSVANSNGKADEELFEDLAKFNDTYDPLYFQSEIKRFESVNNGQSRTAANLASMMGQNQDSNQFYARTSSQVSRKNSYSSRRRRSDKTSIKKLVIDRTRVVIRKRKVCRFFVLLACLSFMTVLIVMFYVFGVKRHRLDVVWANKTVNIRLKNCRLFFQPAANSGEQSLQLEYLTSIKNVFNRVIPGEQTYSFTDSGTKLDYTVQHYDDIRGCNLYVNLPSDLELAAVNIVCEQQCILIHKTNDLKVANLTITGEQVSTNFGPMTVRHLDVSAKKGYIQFNDLTLVEGAYDRHVHLGTGDILIFTQSSLEVAYLTASENYCLSGQGTSTVKPVMMQPIGKTLSSYVTQLISLKKIFTQQWTGTTRVCSDAACSMPISKITTENFDGNIYVNVLERMSGVVPPDASVVKGSRYDVNIDLPLSAKMTIEQNVQETLQRSSPNLIIRFLLGNFEGMSQHGSEWVYTDHSLYSIVKPWWISFFTLTKLVENTNNVETFLSPGFCPYRFVKSRQQNLHISAILRQSLPKKGVISFVQSADGKLDQDPMSSVNGFMTYSKISQFSDEWVETKIVDGKHDIYKPLFLTEHLSIFLMISLSVAAAFFIAYKLTKYLVKLAFLSFKRIREKVYHVEFYWKIAGKENSSTSRKEAVNHNLEEEDGDKLLNIQRMSSLKNFNLRVQNNFTDLPPTTAFIDYMMVELWTGKNHGLNRFYDVIFEEVNYSQILDLETRNLQQDKAPLRTLECKYQQMCFLLNYKEAKLCSQASMKILTDKGMVLTSSDSRRQYLIRITMNTAKDLSIGYVKSNKKQTSLQLFLERFCERTNFDEDMLPFDQFIERYGLFCKLNHMEQTLIDHIILRNKFGIESRTPLKEIIERDYEQMYARENFASSGWLKPFLAKLQSCGCKKSYYKLRLERIRNMNLFLAGKLNETDVGTKEYCKIVDLSILERGWYIRDTCAVLLEIFINMLLSVPFIAIFIFQEIEHSAYSLRSESLNIYGFNFENSDIWLLPQKVVSALPDHAQQSPDLHHDILPLLLGFGYPQPRKQHLSPRVSLAEDLRPLEIPGADPRQHSQCLSVVGQL